jgi:NADPH2:quinone reductase
MAGPRRTKAFRFHEKGGPEVLRLDDVELPPPGRGQILIRQKAIGVNFRDVYRRTGRFPVDTLPAFLGNESVGVVEAVGEGVEEFKVGQRVAVAGGPDTAYAEARVAVAGATIGLPDEIDDKTAAAMMVRGMTARYLLKRTCEVKPGDTILVHAAAGGVGLILCQWGKALGATVIGTVGSEEKAKIARANGCDHTILYRTEDFVARVKEITDGKGVRVVYESIGKDTILGSLKCLADFGIVANFGEVSGPADPIAPHQIGSGYLTFPSLRVHTAKRADFLTGANDVIAAVKSGVFRVNIGATYPFAEAAKAMSDLESRRTTGSVILLV